MVAMAPTARSGAAVKRQRGGETCPSRRSHIKKLNETTMYSIRNVRRVLLYVLALVFSPVGAQSENQATIKIGVSGSFSGGSSPMGESMRNGIRIAADEINRVGGIRGRKVELIERDDEANPVVGAKIAEQLIEQKVVATIGIVNTGVGLASIDAYQAAKIPLIVAVSTGPALTRKFAPPAAPENYIFRVAPTLDLEVKVLVADLKRRGLTSSAILADTTAYGEAGLMALQEQCKLADIDLPSIERFKVGDQDMMSQLKRAQASTAQALVVWGVGPELAVIAKNKKVLAWKAPTLGSWTFSMQNFIDRSGKAGEGVLMPQTFVQDLGVVGKNSFLLAYARAFKSTSIPAPMAAAQGYDAMHLLHLAIYQAHSEDGRKIKEALEDLRRPYQGAVTNYSKTFSKESHDAITQNMFVMGKIVAGKVDYAYAEDERRGAMLRVKEK